MSKTAHNEDPEATTIISSLPYKKHMLTEALEKIRNQTARAEKHQRNFTFRTVASSPKASEDNTFLREASFDQPQF